MNSIWASGIQTCPRYGCDIDRTIDHVVHAGWSDPVVFGEPGTKVDRVESIVWPRQYGDWAGWFSALSCLHATRPDADFFVMFEDDVSMCKNIKVYIESFLFNLPNFGTFHLYTPPKHHYFGRKPCITDESNHGWDLWGAQGVVFTRSSLREFLGSSLNLGYRDTKIGIKNAHKDSAIGTWANSTGRSVYYHTPSLVNHLELPSLIGSSPHKALEYVGDDFDAVDLIGQTPLMGFVTYY